MPRRICTVVAAALAATWPGTAHAARPVPQTVPRLAHVVVVVLENKSASEVVGSPQAPFLNSLARRGALLGDYSGVAHPSLPNYLALVSGSTGGVTSDCTDCTVGGPSLADELGDGWRTYAEDLPSPGFTGAGAGLYAKRHNPFVYFRRVLARPAQLHRVVPFTRLAHDLAARRLPRFALVVPNVCHDAHDCPIGVADAWLRRELSPLLRAQALGNGAVFVVFDESESSDSNRVPAFAVGPAVRPGSTFALPTDHYGLLRTIEQALHVPLLGRARTAQAIGGIWRNP